MLGIVADDITGASDIGILIANRNYVVKIFPYSNLDHIQKESLNSDVIIIDTNSRFDSPIIAYEKVRKATGKLKELGCSQYFKKTCSVFRGNIGVEFDAMQDELEEDYSIVVLGYPKNKRTTINAVHYVDGVPLSKTAFNYDPIHPMIQDNLVEILQKQTTKQVGFINYLEIRKGKEYVKKKIESMKKFYQYIVMDVESEESLNTVSEAIYDNRILCGSAALGNYLPNYLLNIANPKEHMNLNLQNNLGTLIVNGSLTPQTKGQIQFLIENNLAAIVTLNTENIFSEDGFKTEVLYSINQCISLLKQGKDVIVSSPLSNARVIDTKINGRLLLGLNEVESAEVVSKALAEIAFEVTTNLNLKNIVTSGGNTSNAICERLGIKGFLIIDEIDHGVASCLSQGEHQLVVILKSGSFGQVDFFKRSIDYFRTLNLEE